MDFPLTVQPDAMTPIYLQIRYQLHYLITSGRLPEGTRLPTVRAAADRLQVNPGTVAQAYRELQEQGLLEAAPGRGTFVAGTLQVDGDALTRRSLMDLALEKALLRSRALGFREAEIRQHLDTVLSKKLAAVPVLLAAPTTAIARKYATSLERRIGPGLAVRPVTFDEVARRAPLVAALLEEAYFVVTFAGSARQIEVDLEAFASPARVLGLTTEVQPPTLAALEALDDGTRLCLVTQEAYVPPVLRMIEERTGIPADGVRVCLDGDVERARAVLSTADRVVYTFAAREFVIEMNVPPEKRLEVTFDFTEASLERLKTLVLPDGAVSEAADEGTTRPSAWGGIDSRRGGT